jgi:hypothetical protein
MNQFIKAYIAFKTFSSNTILRVGYGITFLFALVMSVLFAFLTVQLYKVPIKDVQIYANKVYGGDEKDYSVLEVKMDYGLDVTKKYKKDYDPGIKLYIYQTDNWRNNKEIRLCTIPHYGIKSLGLNFDYDYKEITKFLTLKEYKKYGNTNFMNKVNSVFAIHFIESNLPWTSFKEEAIDTFEIRKSNVKEAIEKYVIKAVDKESAIYQRTKLIVDTITGLDSFCSEGYVAFADSGLNRPIDIFSSPSLTKPSLFSLFDISQSYFRFTVAVPAEVNGAMIDFDFGGATEFSNIYPEPDNVSMSRISYHNLEKIAYINTHGLWLHAKFRQMENIQIFRMFVMTTLLGFFVALLFSAGCKGLKTASRRYKIKRIKEEKSVQVQDQENIKCETGES